MGWQDAPVVDAQSQQQDSDYDMKGAIAAGVKPDKRGHWPDTYKKPNHITFSDESKYSNEKTTGGKWRKGDSGKWSFTPSKYNLSVTSPDKMREYFKKNEPDSELILPNDNQSSGSWRDAPVVSSIDGHHQDWMDAPVVQKPSKEQWHEQQKEVGQWIHGLAEKGQEDYNPIKPTSEAKGQLTEKGFKSQFPGLEWNPAYAQEYVKHAQAFKAAQAMVGSFTPTIEDAKKIAQSVPKDRESRERVLEAVHNAAVKQAQSGSGASGEGLLGRAGTAAAKGLEKLSGDIDEWTGGGLDDDTARFARQLYTIRNQADPLARADTPWWERGIVNASEMAAPIAASGGVGKLAGGAAKLAKAGEGLTSAVSAAAGMTPFVPGMYDESYDNLLQKGASPKAAKIGAWFSAGLQSAIYGGLAKKLIPFSVPKGITPKFTSEVLSKYLTQIPAGSSAMAFASAGDQAIQEIAGGNLSLKNVMSRWWDSFKGGLETMPFLAAPEAIRGVTKAPGKGEGIDELMSRFEENVKTISEHKDEIVKMAEEGGTPSRAQWMEWGLSGGRSKSDRAKQLQDIAKELQTKPEELPARNIPEKYGIQEGFVDNLKSESSKLKKPEGKTLETLYPADSDKPAITGEQIGTVNGKKVMAVEAEAVNKRLFDDPNKPDFGEFTSGGTKSRYKEIPEDQIWIDKDSTDKERPKFALHEALEDHLMSQHGLEYDKSTSEHPEGAHDIAQKVEQDWARESPGGDVNLNEQNTTVTKAAPVPPTPTIKYQSPSVVKGFMHGLMKVLNPTAIKAPGVREATHILNLSGAKAAQWDEVAIAHIGKLDDTFYRMTPKENIQFALDVDEGKKHLNPDGTVNGRLTAIARALDEARAEAWERVQERRGSGEFIENYFPRIFKRKPGSDVVAGKIMSKAFRKSGFLKHRTRDFLRESLDAGLELEDENPVHLYMKRIHQMNEWCAKTDAFNSLKQSGLARFVPASMEKDYTPFGYKLINDPTFNVQSGSSMTIKEAYDKLLHDQLHAVAANIGVKINTATKLKKGVLGFSVEGGKEVTRAFATPLGTLAHEIGHQIGDIFGLGKYIDGVGKAHPEMKIEEEWTKLAALRHEGQAASDFFKGYVQEPAEREAVILQAWLDTPDKMQRDAPNITELWKKFLGANEPISPLLHLDRSVVLGTSETEFEQPGVRVLGRWALPDDVATLVENNLSLGLRSNPNEAISGAYRVARLYGNALNQASLGLSAYHAIFTSLDSIFSQAGLGFHQATRGEFKQAAANIAQSPLAPFSLYKRGKKIQTVMKEDLDQIQDPEIRELIELGMTGGMRSSLDQRYSNNSYRVLKDTFYDLKNHTDFDKGLGDEAKIAVHSILGAIELAAAPIMKYQVPRLKLGVANLLLKDLYSRAEKTNIDDFQKHEQATQIVNSVENRLGQLCYDNLHWNQLMTDACQLAFRSTGWNLGFIREYGGSVSDLFSTKSRVKSGGDWVTGRQAYVITAIIGNALIGGTLHYLMNGKPPETLYDYMFPKTGNKNPDGSDERIALPSYMKDIVSYSSNPLRTVQHKLHPMWGSVLEILRNEDFYGGEVRNAKDPIMQQIGDSLLHLGKAFVPFSKKNFDQMKKADDPTWKAALLGVTGMTAAPAYITQTKAIKLANQYLGERLPTKPRTKEQVESSQKHAKLVRTLRTGKTVSKEDMKGMTSDQYSRALKEASMSPLSAKVGRLSLEQALDVYAVSDKEEKKQLFQAVINKRERLKSISPTLLKYYNDTMSR